MVGMLPGSVTNSPAHFEEYQGIRLTNNFACAYFLAGSFGKL